jgi:hypothetical protein
VRGIAENDLRVCSEDALIAPYDKPENVDIVVVGGETSPMWKVAEFGYTASASVDKWRVRPVTDGGADGSLGLPDEPGDKWE